MSLERRYRRRIALFPRHWRAEHEEEMLGVLLQGAAPNQRRVSAAETLDLLAAAAGMQLSVVRRRLKGRALTAIGAIAVVASAVIVGLVGAGGRISPQFLATSLVVVLIPGTGVVYTVSSSIAGGFGRGSVAALGCTLGIVPHMVAAMLGLSGVMQAGAAAFEIVRWVGVAYLAFMGLSMIRDGGSLQLTDGGPRAPVPPLAVVRRGILLNLLNPKLTIFFFAFLPQFIATTPQLLDARLIGLGLVFMAITFVVFVGYAAASATLRRRVLDSPRIVRWVQRTLGTLLVGFAARLAVADR